MQISPNTSRRPQGRSSASAADTRVELPCRKRSARTITPGKGRGPAALISDGANRKTELTSQMGHIVVAGQRVCRASGRHRPIRHRYAGCGWRCRCRRFAPAHRGSFGEAANACLGDAMGNDHACRCPARSSHGRARALFSALRLIIAGVVKAGGARVPWAGRRLAQSRQSWRPSV